MGHAGRIHVRASTSRTKGPGMTRTSLMRRTGVAPVTDYLEGQGNLVSRLIRGITGIIMWVIGVINLLTKSS